MGIKKILEMVKFHHLICTTVNAEKYGESADSRKNRAYMIHVWNSPSFSCVVREIRSAFWSQKRPSWVFLRIAGLN